MHCGAFAAVFLALLLSGAPFSLDWGAAQTCFGSGFTGGGTISVQSTFDSPIATTVMAMVFLIAIAYMLGSALEKPELAFWAKVEMQNLLIAGLLVMLIIAAFAGGCTLMFDQAGGKSPFASIDSSLGKMEKFYGIDMSKKLVSNAMDSYMRAVSYIYVNAQPSYQKGIGYRANQRARAQYREMVVDMQLPFLVSINVQRLAFQMANLAVLNIILPAAILFRAFFVTRDVGNFMLALALGLYFVLPMAYLLAYTSLGEIGKEDKMDALKLEIPGDNVVGDGLIRIGYMATAAILVPNIALVFLISFVMAANKGLRGIGA